MQDDTNNKVASPEQTKKELKGVNLRVSFGRGIHH